MEAICDDLGATKTVLVVDDEPNVLRLICRLLESKGFKVFGANCGETAIPIWLEHSQEIDLLLTDVVMPGISGFDLAAALRNKKPGLKVLVISGFLPDDFAECFREPDPYAFLAKPFSPQVLTQNIDKLFAASAPAAAQVS